MSISKKLVEIINESQKKGTSAYDTQGEVVRVDGDTAWVHFAGGVDETPVRMTVNANVGDNVQVRVSGGDAFLIGNQTSPATDDTVANEANHQAYEALGMAASAGQSAELAKTAADVAVQSAERAQASADQSEELLAGMQVAAEEVGTTLEGIYQDAKRANDNADAAQASANQAIEQASFIENVVGVVDWIATHATYALSDDVAVVPNTLYFTLTGEAVTSPTGSPADNGYYELVNGVYVLSTDTTVDQQKTYYTVTASVVNTPTGNPSTNGYYELVDVKEGVSNYVSTHLALTNDGLLLQNDTSNGYRLLISPTEGIVLYSPSGRMASYGQNAVIGDPNGFHITITDSRLSFYRDASNEVAYVSGDKLYITQSVVLQQMDIGTTVANGGLGQWSWKVHANADNRNNLYLKWLG